LKDATVGRFWLVLPLSWDLSNVRAVLALVIHFVSVLGIWIWAYSFWKLAALRVARSRSRSHTPAASPVRLLSLHAPSGLGDVHDVLPLLRLDLGVGLLLALATQTAVIVLLSATALLSAPLSRYSTRMGTRVDVVWFVGVKRLPEGVSAVPRTKVQWMMQGMKEAARGEGIELPATWVKMARELRGARFVEVDQLSDGVGGTYGSIQVPKSNVQLGGSAGSPLRNSPKSLD
jgi:hypothetical protein